MIKDNLLGLYQTKQNQIELAYASLILWSYPDMPRFFDELHTKMDDFPRFFPNVSSFIHNNGAMRIACEELFDSAHRSAIKELLSLTNHYCHNTGQLQTLKSQPWYEFWRILRNCWSHDMTFNFNSNEKALLPIAWSGVSIDLSMNGNYLTHGQCSREKLRELIKTANNFVAEKLT